MFAPAPSTYAVSNGCHSTARPFEAELCLVFTYGLFKECLCSPLCGGAWWPRAVTALAKSRDCLGQEPRQSPSGEARLGFRGAWGAWIEGVDRDLQTTSNYPALPPIAVGTTGALSVSLTHTHIYSLSLSRSRSLSLTHTHTNQEANPASDVT